MIDIIAEPMFDHHVEHAEAFASGLSRHGLASRTITPEQAAQADTVVCWGWRIAAPLVAAGKRVLVMERGYIGDRNRWTSLGWNGLNGRAGFPQAGEGRFAQYHAELMQPWRPEGSYALLIGQVDGDASLQGMSFQPWAEKTAARAAQEFGLPVKYRPHPVAIERGQAGAILGTERIDGTLAEALHEAAVVITFNSNAGVESVLAGKPTIAFDRGSMAWPVAAHGWSIPLEPDRLAWANQVASNQWTLDEIRSGAAWAHVRAN